MTSPSRGKKTRKKASRAAKAVWGARPIKSKPRKKTKPPVKVKGYWVISGRKAYYVKPYTRKPPKKHRRPPGEPVYFVWRILAIMPIWATTTNGSRFFADTEVDPEEDATLAVYLHTRFTRKRPQSIRLLRSLINQTITRVPETEFQTFSLFKVYGGGPVTEKHWHIEETYLDESELPKRT